MVHGNLDNRTKKCTASQAPIVSCVYADEPCPTTITSIKALLASYYERRQGLAE